ncbi:MAG TPA: ATPase domain-containing protein [Chloroflexota bacterium]|jgi:circadian clock protein KaiC|nr:ATPase domain-containing protein [Chloroflexota bacterium]
MTNISGAALTPPAPMPTRVPGLDAVLRGGFPRGGAYLIGGPPGTGKTTLGNQIAFAHAAAGESAVFASILSEPHDRMLANLAGFDFFDESLVGGPLQFVNIFDSLSGGDLMEGLTVLRDMIRRQRATLAVLDGTSALEQMDLTAIDLSRFVYDLHAQGALLGCTVLLLALTRPGAPRPIETYVDGLISLEDQSVGQRDLRYLRVPKLRGVDQLRGRHSYTISGGGLRVFPRIESANTLGYSPESREALYPFGIEGLDNMLRGGVHSGSSTLVLGTPGAGKTMLGLHFIAAGQAGGERGLIASLRESPEELRAKASSVGLSLNGPVEILWHRPTELAPDAWAESVLEAVARNRSTRVMIDSAAELDYLLEPTPGRLRAFFTALLDALSSAGATVVVTGELRTLVGEVGLPLLATMADNALLLRSVELRSQLHRIVSVIKAGHAAHDTALREFRIDVGGVQVADTFETAEAVLTGVARMNPASGRVAPGPSGVGETSQ